MATMIPTLTTQEILDLHGSQAEADLYQLLEEQLPPKFTALYSVNWIDGSGNGRPREGEADFIVLHPDIGMLVVEVKGGQLEVYGGGNWVRRIDGKAERIPNPFVQAQDGSKTLSREIESRLGFRGFGRYSGHALALLDIDFDLPQIGLGGPRELVIGGQQRTHLEQRVKEIFKYWQQDHAEAPSAAYGDAWVSKVIDLLHTDAVLKPSLGVEIARDEQAFLRLTEAQSNAMKLLSLQTRACVSGGAGSGKTVLAFAKSVSAAEAGNRTLLTCFNKPLADRLTSDAEGVDGLQVMTFHELCRQTALEFGLEFDSGLGPKPASFFSETLPELLISAIEKMDGPKYDVIVVDEAQDFEADWLASLELLLGDPGEGTMFWFRDVAQNIYERPIVELGHIPEFTLTENVRNTVAIHEAACGFADSVEMSCSGPVGRDIDIVPCDSEREIRKEISRTLHRLVRDEHVAEFDIAIIIGRSMNSTFLKNDRQFGAFEVKRIGEIGDRATIESLWRYKGLEAPVVLFVDFPENVPATHRYVALSRAKSQAIFIGSQSELKAWTVAD